MSDNNDPHPERTAAIIAAAAAVAELNNAREWLSRYRESAEQSIAEGEERVKEKLEKANEALIVLRMWL